MKVEQTDGGAIVQGTPDEILLSRDFCEEYGFLYTEDHAYTAKISPFGDVTVNGKHVNHACAIRVREITGIAYIFQKDRPRNPPVSMMIMILLIALTFGACQRTDRAKLLNTEDHVSWVTEIPFGYSVGDTIYIRTPMYRHGYYRILEIRE